MLGRKELIPKRVERLERAADLGLGHAFDGLAGAAPGLDDDFRGKKQNSHLVDHDLLDLGGRNARNGTIARALLKDGLAQIVAVEPAILPCVRRRHGDAGGTEDDPLQKGGRLRPCGSRSFAGTFLKLSLHLVPGLAVDDADVLTGVRDTLRALESVGERPY